MGRRIAVLQHERDAKRQDQYLISLFAEYWREDGHEVIYLAGTKHYVPADVIILHVDLSLVPEEYFRFAGRYPAALNARVRDIRKSSFSTDLLAAGDDWSGRVIVKSDNNFAGLPERERGPWPLRSRLVQRATAALERRLRGSPPFFATPADYRIYESLADVPAGFFADRTLVVQKFLPELDHGLYAVRHMTFIGQRATCVRLTSPQPIINGDVEVKVEQVEVHPEIDAVRKQLGFDYGKFDYVIHEGRPILLDVNKTIGAPAGLLEKEELRRIRRYRAEGLYEYFR